MTTPSTLRRGLSLLALLLSGASFAGRQALPPKGPAGWEAAHGWKSGGVTDKSATTVILIHGLGSQAANFIAPYKAWNVKDIDYDPKTRLVLLKELESGVSPKAPRHNFFDELGNSALPPLVLAACSPTARGREP